MFTRNPITGADERMIEASWGLGEAVVSGRVIPDSFRVARTGEVLERRAGLKKFAIRSAPDGGTFDEDVAADLVESLCLSDEQLQALSGLADGLRAGVRRRSATSSGPSPTDSSTCCSAAR